MYSNICLGVKPIVPKMNLRLPRSSTCRNQLWASWFRMYAASSSIGCSLFPPMTWPWSRNTLRRQPAWPSAPTSSRWPLLRINPSPYLRSFGQLIWWLSRWTRWGRPAFFSFQSPDNRYPCSKCLDVYIVCNSWHLFNNLICLILLARFKKLIESK